MSTATKRSDPSKNGLRFLQNIITESSKDVGTQTSNGRRRKMRSPSPSTPPNYVVNVGKDEKTNFHESTVSFFIVGADKECPVIRLSVDGAKRGPVDSCRLSLKPATTDNISTDLKPKHKVTEGSSSKSVAQLPKKRCPVKGHSRPMENEFTTEHRLSHSINPSVIAWLKLKNFEEKEKQREKRQKRKELKQVAEQEAERKQNRIKESEKKYTKWLQEKKLAEKRARKAFRVKTKTSTIETEQQDQNEDVPPPNYTVVPTFKGVVAWTEAKKCDISPTTKSPNCSSARKLKKCFKRPQTTDDLQKKPPDSRARPKTTDVRRSEGDVSNRISYDDWMRKKRAEDQEKAKEKRRNTVDDALTEGILKLARRRIENIRQGKKEVDTGLPKWRAKNRVTSDEKSASADIIGTGRNIYSGPYRLPPESHETVSTSQPEMKLRGKHFARQKVHHVSQVVEKPCPAREIETIRQFCDKTKLESKTNVEMSDPNQDVLCEVETPDVKLDEFDQG